MTMEIAELVEELRAEIRGLASPWRTRKGAAHHLGCSEATIDVLVARGELERHYLAGSPRFKVADLDALVTQEKKALKEMRAAA